MDGAYIISPSGPNLGVAKQHDWLDAMQLGYRVQFRNTGVLTW